MFKMPVGPFCQSCGMPLNDENILGTEKDGAKSTEYCTYCYKDGGFSVPNMTLDDMLKKATSILVEKKGMPLIQASLLTKMFIPKLKRWKSS